MKILIIGLDGATFDIIMPLIKDGRLPNIGRLMEHGCWGELRSTILPVTPPAWASFLTGKNPAKHGVYGFYSFRDNHYSTSLTTSISIKAKKFWEYLDNHRICLIDVPMTYPPEEVNGCMISGMPVPSEESIFTHPPSLHTELIREIGDYMIDKQLSAMVKTSPLQALKHLYQYTKMRRDASLYLINKKGPFDIFMIVFRGTDFIQHYGFKYLDSEYIKREIHMSRKLGEIIYQFYDKIDEYIGDLWDAMGRDSTVILMSDHGGGLMKKRFYINRWLKREGFLHVKNRGKRESLGLGQKSVSEILLRLRLSSARFLPNFIKDIKIPYPRATLYPPEEIVDWSKTRAFSNLNWTDGVIRINLKGREPGGIVEEREYDKIRDDIIKGLQGIEDADTGEPIIERAYKREEIYNGPFLEHAPDIVVLTKETSYVFGTSLEDGPILERPKDPSPAPHRMNGIFIACGLAIRNGGEIQGLNLMDITPTILYLMDKPIPDDVDGKVIRDAISEEYLISHPIRHLAAEKIKEREEYKLTDEEEERLKESLKSLGYIE
jgi:predicted AlkP superfamily phosphohydrolase/phosphomutase